MIRSMTAFATREEATPFGHLVWEIRSVNHRYLELALRLPEEFRALEPRLRERTSARITRGKVDVGLRVRGTTNAAAGLRLNDTLAKEVARLSRELGLIAPDLAPGTRMEALSWPGMIVEPDADQSAVHDAALQVFEGALADFVATREREGIRLRGFLIERLDAIKATVTQIKEWLPDIRTALRQRLETKLADLKLPLDPGRLEQEIVLNLQKLDVDEELDRLSAHLEEARHILDRGEPSGRRLDFLLQEFNREANTLGSKSVDQRTSQAAVELKVLIEQLREQVQNLE
jgi:uncharacterized protein (TIGR00255 family)